MENSAIAVLMIIYYGSFRRKRSWIEEDVKIEIVRNVHPAAALEANTNEIEHTYQSVVKSKWHQMAKSEMYFGASNRCQ